MHTGYYFGTFLAAIVNYAIGAKYGWRAVFAVGGAPALLVAFIRYGVAEPKRWQHRMQQLGETFTARRAFFALFGSEYRSRTLLERDIPAGLDDRVVGRIGICAVVRYLPGSAIGMEFLARRAARVLRDHAVVDRNDSRLPADAVAGRALRPASGIGLSISLLMFVFIAFGFGYAFYLPQHALLWFLVSLFFLGSRWRQFCGLYALASGAVQDGVPR